MNMRFIWCVLTIAFACGIFYALSRPPETPSYALGHAIEECQKKSDRTAFIVCVRTFLRSRIKKYGIEPYMKALVDAYAHGSKPDARTARYCHDIAHSLGQMASEYAKSTSDALRQCSTLCGAGCYHGVIEGYVSKGGDLNAAFQTLCSVSGNELFERNRWACFHGLGHGIGSMLGDFQKSLAICDRIPDDDDKKNCDRGVMMELFESSSFEHAKLQVPADVQSFCGRLTGVHREVCFGNIGMEIYIQSHSIDQSVEACLRGPVLFQDDCIGLLGNAMYHEVGGDTQKLLAVCKQTGRTLPCIYGAVQEDVLTDSFARAGLSLCSALSVDLKESCYRYLGERVKSIHGAAQQELLCTSIKLPYASYCAEGSAL